MKEGYLCRIIFCVFISLLCISTFVSAIIVPKNVVSLRAYGGEFTINGYSLDPMRSRMDIKLVEKDGICSALMQISTHSQNNERRVLFTANMRAKEFCTIEDSDFSLNGNPAISYKSIPKIHKYLVKGENGRLIWVHDLLSEPDRQSKIVSAHINKTGNYISITSPFFSIKDMDVIDFALKHI